MKRIYLLLFISFILPSGLLFAQDQKDPAPPQRPALPTPAYKQNPELPAFNMLLLDSTTVFNTYNIPKGRPIAIMTFMPDCEHCQKLTEKLLNGMDTLKNIRFYLVSPMDLKDIRKFYEKYNLSKYPNIVIGKDRDNFGPVFFQIKYVPFIALYDKNKQLITSYEQTVEVKELAKTSKKKGTFKKESAN